MTLSESIFWSTYTSTLHWMLDNHPTRYFYDHSEVPSMVERIQVAVAAHKADLSSPAFTRTCRQLGIPVTAKAIYRQLGMEN